MNAKFFQFPWHLFYATLVRTCLVVIPFILSYTISLSYAQRVGLKNNIIFVDSFDTGKLNERWITNQSNAIRINHDPRNVHSGCCSLEVVARPGKSAGGMARIFLEPGYDKVHVRWYCKFDADFDQGNLMHLNKLIASKEKWTATAGQRPTGYDFFRTTLDLWRDWGRNPAPGEPIFYSYFPFMKKDRKTSKYWGNMFKPKRKVLIKRGKWYCMEMMLRANTAGHQNGMQAFWINGRPIGIFKSMVWRFTSDLKINSFMIGLYIHDNAKFNRVWYDDVVVSTGFIGP